MIQKGSKKIINYKSTYKYNKYHWDDPVKNK